MLKTGDVCAAGQEIENVHNTFQEVIAEVFVQRAEATSHLEGEVEVRVARWQAGARREVISGEFDGC